MDDVCRLVGAAYVYSGSGTEASYRLAECEECQKEGKLTVDEIATCMASKNLSLPPMVLDFVKSQGAPPTLLSHPLR